MIGRAHLIDDYYFNFDEKCLYKGNEKIVEITGRPYDLLYCLCQHPNMPLSLDRISDMIGAMDDERGRDSRVKKEDYLYASTTTVKTWKSKLLSLHEVFSNPQVISSTRNSGYTYHGGPIILTQENLEADGIFFDHLMTATPVVSATTKSVLYREHDCQAILSLLQSKDTNHIVLSGMGGRGKTSIARLLYFALRDQYDCYGWVNYCGDLKQSLIDSLILDDYSDDTVIEHDVKKKWNYIQKLFAKDKQKKLLVLDNVDEIHGIQNPVTDKDLASFAQWNNLTIIVTTRLNQLPGFTTVYPVLNLGDENKCDLCVNLFYHYNENARKFRGNNREIVEKLCSLASYNAMVIELLAKASYVRYKSLEDFYQELCAKDFHFIDRAPVATDHDNTVIRTMSEDGTISDSYYDSSTETAASQLMKLFNPQIRRPIERQIIWDFHCLPEAEKVSLSELENWMGYNLLDITGLIKEGWVKEENEYYSIHPLISQSIACMKPEWEMYWELGEERRRKEDAPSLVSRLKSQTLFADEDKFFDRIRKIKFSYYLSYEGRFLDADTLMYVADHARKMGVNDVSCDFYRASYEAMLDFAADLGLLSDVPITEITEEDLAFAKLFWKSAYFYAYLLSYATAGDEEAEGYLELACRIIKQLEHVLTEEEFYHLEGMSLDHYGYVKGNKHSNLLIDYVNACMLYRLAIFYREKLVEQYPDNIHYFKDLAWSYDNLGYLFALADLEHLEGEKGCDDDLCLKGDGALYTYEDEYNFLMSAKEKAEPYLQQALDMRIQVGEQMEGGNLSEIAWTSSNLASVLAMYTDRYAEAEEHIMRALTIYRKLDELFPDQHLSSIARTYSSYGKLLAKWQGRKEDAKEAFEKSLQINLALNQDYPGRYIREIEANEMELLRLR